MAVAEPGNFFKQKRSASEIKAEILPQYFKWWVANAANLPAAVPEKVIYLDLQAGTGYSPEEQPAAPVLLLQQIAEDISTEDNPYHLVQTYFYDGNEANVNKLQENVLALPFYPNLVKSPSISSEPETAEILLPEVKAYPTLIALDSLTGSFATQVLTSTLPGANADFFMVISYNKMRQALLAAKPDSGLELLFKDTLPQIRENDQREKSTKKREQQLVLAWAAAFKKHGYFTFRFKINLPGKDQTSHYLFLATPNKAGYLALKEIMYPYSVLQEDGVPLYISDQKEQPPLLPGFFRLISEYGQENLTNELAQQKSLFHYKTVQAIYEEHSVGTPYIKINYLKALTQLKEAGILNLVDQNNKQVKTITDTTVVFYKLHGQK